ncbi:MAG: YgeY family selenium metabolism-linked hydrolase [Negativicutes bacterium]|nr:YgeY family selenium metabolism-linked hydrolase [Negativicutes bacterium]
MNQKVQDTLKALESQLIAFAQDLVRIQSFTGQEEAIVQRIKQEMEKLDYDEILIDKVGNIIGRMGSGPVKILFDSHADHVSVSDAGEWRHGPYSGDIEDGRLYGRASTDMKGSLAATVYAGHIMKKLGLAEGKTIFICGSVMEEDFDGEGLYHAIVDNELKPDYVVICEPSHLNLAMGHLGRAIYKINIKGTSAHGAAPERGDNAVYKAAAIIARIEALGKQYMALPPERPSIALTKIESTSASLNAVPGSCILYIDRRITCRETEESVGKELDFLIGDLDADWEIYDATGKSYTGEDILLHSYLPAWEIAEDHPLAQGCIAVYQEIFGKKPAPYKWDFSTNGVASAKLGIPTIGFGAGDEKMAHMADEYCPLSDILLACKFFALLPLKL